MLTSGDVVYVDLGVPAGQEAGFRHPAVIVTAQPIIDAGARVLQIVPLTSTVRGFGSEVTIEVDPASGLSHRSSAQCQHIRAVAGSRIDEVRGNVGPVVLAQIREVLGVVLDIG